MIPADDTNKHKRFLNLTEKTVYKLWKHFHESDPFMRILKSSPIGQLIWQTTGPYLIKRNVLSEKQLREFMLLKDKRQINVIFLVPDKETWGMEPLYRLMEKSPYYNPVIAVFPYQHIDMKIKVHAEKYHEDCDFFEKKGFNTRRLFNEETNEFLNLSTLSPDIVCFNFTFGMEQTWHWYSQAQEYITFYTSYGYFLTNSQESQFNMPYHNSINYLFWESPLTVEMSQKYADNKGINSYFMGYPKLDILLAKKRTAQNVWKKQGRSKKRIIWAPHHSIEENPLHGGYSCFLKLFDFMLKTAQKYKDSIQFAFKPHPLLQDRLYIHPDWGREKTDAYYQKWQELENGQLETEGYTDLFLTSDAMIMDSISFMCEYAALNKPCLFTLRDETIPTKFNEFGERVFNEILYKTKPNSTDEITAFIENNVLMKKDPLQETRKAFVKKYLLSPNGKSASENILDFLEQELQK